MFAGLTDRSWLWLAAECYFVGLMLGTWSFTRRNRQSGVWLNTIITVGYLFQLTGLWLRGRAVGGSISSAATPGSNCTRPSRCSATACSRCSR